MDEFKKLWKLLDGTYEDGYNAALRDVLERFQELQEAYLVNSPKNCVLCLNLSSEAFEGIISQLKKRSI